MKKRVLSILLALLMVAALLPVTVLAEGAEVPDAAPVVEEVPAVEEAPVIEEAPAAEEEPEAEPALEAAPVEEEPVEALALDGGTSVAKIVETGTTYATVQAAIDAAAAGQTVQMLDNATENIEVASDKTVTLNLDGKTLTGTGTGSVITVKGSLTLNDSVGTGTITGGNAEHGGGVYVNSGTFKMYGGEITNNYATQLGGGIYLNGIFNMYDGEITGNKTGNAKNGAGVYVNSGTFTMSGGKIADNNVPGNNGAPGGGYGAGVYVNTQAAFAMKGDSVISGNIGGQGAGVYTKGTFTMSGNSEVTNNTGTYGGGVGVCSGASFTMSESSKITNNTGTNGGGLCVNNDGLFQMFGSSTINNNIGSGYGGGVFANGSVTLGGEAKITGNIKGEIKSGVLVGDPQNVFLPNGKYITLGTNLKPTGDFKVGVTTQTAPTDGVPVKITTNGASTDTNYFASDDTDYEVKYNASGYLELAVKTTPSYTIADILPADFPTSSADGWLNENGGKSYIMNGNLFVYGKTNVELSKSVTKKDDGNYEYQGTSGTKITFVMESGKLTKINVSGSVYTENNGTYVAPHVHVFTYAANGGKLTATCMEGCDKGYDTTPLTLTLTAPASLVYDGNAKEFTFADGEAAAWTGAGLELPTIIYYVKQNGQSAYMPLLGTLKSVGNYMAQITVGEKTAQVEFTIDKATPYIKTNPEPTDIVYGKKLADSTLAGGYAQVSSTNTTQVGGLFEWTNPDTVPGIDDSEVTEYDVTFTPADTNNYNTVSCQVKIKVNHTHNPVLVNGQPATKEAAGWKDYYECACGDLFEDKDGTTPIDNLATWKAEGGRGYLAPLPYTIADILPEYFPTSYLTAWKTEQGLNTCHLDLPNSRLMIVVDGGEYIAATTAPVTPSGDDYVYTDEDGSVTFNMKNGELTSIAAKFNDDDKTYVYALRFGVTVNGGNYVAWYLVDKGTAYSVSGNTLTLGDKTDTAGAIEGKEFDCWKIGETAVAEGGTITADTIFTAAYKDVHTHDPVKVNGQPATEKAAGWKDYYECACGALFEDKDGTTPIDNLATWKAEGGRGYLPKLEEPAPSPTPAPEKPEKPMSPKTGDNSMIGLWLAIFAVCGLGLTAGTIYSKKKKRN